jgi:hypothetical protein
MSRLTTPEGVERQPVTARGVADDEDVQDGADDASVGFA